MSLPIQRYLPDIHHALAKHSALVLQAEPGAGKSTALPLSLLDADWLNGRKILMLEPRRVAARSIANYLARQLGEKVGQRVGYQVRNEKRIGPETVLEILTEGMLTRRLQQDPELSDCALLIFDEFHERSLHSDLGLLLSKECQLLRDDLKLLVMSATIDTEALSRYLDGAPVIQCEGRAFPVTVGYRGNSVHRPKPLQQQVLEALQQALGLKDHGDILVFLPGQADIRRCQALAEEALSQDVCCLPLHGGLSLDAQEAALAPVPGKTKILFASNIAETSLTVEGIRCVIDSGLEKIARFDPASGMTRLDSVMISKASAIQRMGRAGRTAPGHCLRLWEASRESSQPEFQRPDIERLELAQALLECSAWGMSDLTTVDWLTMPPKAHVSAASQLLRALSLIDEKNRITALGSRALALGLEPRLAAMLAGTENEGERALACEIAALLSERDILRQQDSVDFRRRLDALRKGRSPMVKRLANNLRKRLKLDSNAEPDDAALASLLFAAFPDRLAKLRNSDGDRYLLANGRGTALPANDALRGEAWLQLIDADAQKREGRILSAIAVAEQDVVAMLAPYLEEKTEVDIDLSQERVRGSRVQKYRAITLKQQALGEINGDTFQDSLPAMLEKYGLQLLAWDIECEDWLARAQWLGKQCDDFPALDKETLSDTLSDWFLPYAGNVKSLKALRSIELMPLLQANLDWNQQELLAREAPVNYQAPTGKSYAIVYDKDQGPTVSVVLQEMFGELSSPSLAFNRVPLRFELLSPARRPLQTTSDLAGFWQSSYFDIAKEMRGRYPKHRWPEEPLKELPGHSLKKRFENKQ